MKRLFYATPDISDVEHISDEIHAKGVDDHHFYVINRDEDAIKTHHLHGGTSLENSKLFAGNKKSNVFAALAGSVSLILIASHSEVFGGSGTVPIPLLLVVAAILVFVVRMVGASFDNYFLNLFNQHIDAGETIVVIDVERNKIDDIKSVLGQHPKAYFLADCSSVGAPIPD